MLSICSSHFLIMREISRVEERQDDCVCGLCSFVNIFSFFVLLCGTVTIAENRQKKSYLFDVDVTLGFSKGSSELNFIISTFIKEMNAQNSCHRATARESTPIVNDGSNTIIPQTNKFGQLGLYAVLITL